MDKKKTKNKTKTVLTTFWIWELKVRPWQIRSDRRDDETQVKITDIERKSGCKTRGPKSIQIEGENENMKNWRWIWDEASQIFSNDIWNKTKCWLNVIQIKKNNKRQNTQKKQLCIKLHVYYFIYLFNFLHLSYQKNTKLHRPHVPSLPYPSTRTPVMNAALGLSPWWHEATGRRVYLHVVMLSALLPGEGRRRSSAGARLI